MTDDPHESAPASVRIAIQCLIVYSTVTVMLETVPSFAGYKEFFVWSERIVVAIFTAEYAICWMLSKDKLRYPFRIFSIIDLLAILPFYLKFADLRMLRLLRCMYIFRILKIARYGAAMETLGLALRRCREELVVTVFVALIVLVICSMGLYYAEHEAQPNVFSSMPASLWAAIVTLTTVGYGDVYPVTLAGRLMAGLLMLLGIGVVAIPTGIISGQFTELLAERRISRQALAAKGQHFKDP